MIHSKHLKIYMTLTCTMQTANIISVALTKSVAASLKQIFVLSLSNKSDVSEIWKIIFCKDYCCKLSKVTSNLMYH